MDARTHAVCALCGACDTTTAVQDCGHAACVTCCVAVTDPTTHTVRTLCDDCLLASDDIGPIAWG